MTAPLVRIIVALPAEAKPINHHFKLQRNNKIESYPVYQNGHITLLLSGTGRERAAQATHWLHETFPEDDNCAWINVGIAGHSKAPIGTPLLASSLMDDLDGPILTAKPPKISGCPQAPLISVHQPHFNYAQEALFDMEGYGFFEAASRYSLIEQVQCLKLVSDNPDNPAQKINGKMVSGLIKDNLEILELLIHMLEARE